MLPALTFRAPMFHVATGAVLVIVGGLLVSATYGEAPLLAARSAAQITGWLCIAAMVVDLCAVSRRSHGLRNVRRPTFGQGMAGVTTLLTGAFILYMSYFEWSELRAVPMREAAAAERLPRGMPDPSFRPAAGPLQKVASRSGAVVAIHNLPATPRRPAKLLVATVGAPRAPDDACSTLDGLPRLWCEEGARLEYCADRQDADPLCPSPIPASLPY
jgi:hypothetical protein